jgi:hypothetical protein
VDNDHLTQDIKKIAMGSFASYLWPKDYPRHLRCDSWKNRALSAFRLLTCYLPSLFGRRLFLCEACLHPFVEDMSSFVPSEQSPGTLLLPYCDSCGPAVAERNKRFAPRRQGGELA